MNSDPYSQQLMRLKQEVERRCNRKGVAFHHDNTRPHTSSVTQRRGKVGPRRALLGADSAIRYTRRAGARDARAPDKCPTRLATRAAMCSFKNHGLVKCIDFLKILGLTAKTAPTTWCDRPGVRALCYCSARKSSFSKTLYIAMAKENNEFKNVEIKQLRPHFGPGGGPLYYFDVGRPPAELCLHALDIGTVIETRG
ncbi:hypothetical protein EVAR_15079_1 [Eumeta japonica]|uniref:Histone-lysine N-methyltransferase SETMAR n=1 Tax=Eumeta variegata TaxID=151549 RepID=A0A4C1YL76_EUMVA|nr:hypothetical protein EVAR_15079_1 [Eumeta japonica]